MLSVTAWTSQIRSWRWRPATCPKCEDRCSQDCSCFVRFILPASYTLQTQASRPLCLLTLMNFLCAVFLVDLKVNIQASYGALSFGHVLPPRCYFHPSNVPCLSSLLGSFPYFLVSQWSNRNPCANVVCGQCLIQPSLLPPPVLALYLLTLFCITS